MMSTSRCMSTLPTAASRLVPYFGGTHICLLDLAGDFSRLPSGTQEVEQGGADLAGVRPDMPQRRATAGRAAPVITTGRSSGPQPRSRPYSVARGDSSWFPGSVPLDRVTGGRPPWLAAV